MAAATFMHAQLFALSRSACSHLSPYSTSSVALRISARVHSDDAGHGRLGIDADSRRLHWTWGSHSPEEGRHRPHDRAWSPLTKRHAMAHIGASNCCDNMDRPSTFSDTLGGHCRPGHAQARDHCMAHLPNRTRTGLMVSPLSIQEPWAGCLGRADDDWPWILDRWRLRSLH